MAWARLDDNFHSHPKVHACSLAAVGLWTLALSWAAEHRRPDIPTSTVKALARNYARWRKTARELVDAGLWLETDAGYRIHDFDDYQPQKRPPVEPDDDHKKQLKREQNRRAYLRRKGVPPTEFSATETTDSVPLPDPEPTESVALKSTERATDSVPRRKPNVHDISRIQAIPQRNLREFALSEKLTCTASALSQAKQTSEFFDAELVQHKGAADSVGFLLKLISDARRGTRRSSRATMAESMRTESERALRMIKGGGDG